MNLMKYQVQQRVLRRVNVGSLALYGFKPA